MATMRAPRVRRSDGFEDSLGDISAGPVLRMGETDSPRVGVPGNEPRMPVPPDPGGQPGDAGRGGETPRDRVSPLSSMSPSPHAGASTSGPGGGGGGMSSAPIPFSPMSGGGGVGLRSMFGRNRGLQGGGLGMMSPGVTSAENQPIDGLIQQLLMLGKGKPGGPF
jgi:hypothetical protein